MAAAPKSILFILLLLISTPFLSSSHISPSPSPSSSISHSTLPSASPFSSPSPSNFGSPPSPTDLKDSPTPSPSEPSQSTSPAPTPVHKVEKAAAADVTSDHNDASDDKNGGSGMSGGKKAGIAFGVIGAVVLVGLGAIVYKRRQENIRRSRYGYNARMMEMI